MASNVKGKTVATSYLTSQSLSKIRCVEKSYKEGKQGKCIVAGYNKASKICRLSMDSVEDLLDIANDSSGVFI